MILSDFNVKLILGLVATCAVHWQCSFANADMMWLNDTDTPVSGLVLRQDADSIEYQYRLGDQEKTIRVDRARIKDLVVTIDSKVLEQLKPTDLRAYLDYAEQLSTFQSDSYAMDLAKRLCLITARWAQPELRKSAFRLLISICQGEEKVRVQRLAFIYDPTIELPSTGSTVAGDLPVASRDAVLHAIRLIWQDQSEEAKRRLTQEEDREAVQLVLDAYSGVCRMDELMSAVNSEELSLNQLGQVLRLEQAISQGTEPSGKRSRDAGENWSAVAGQIENTRSVLPEFGNVLSIDPDLTIYRDRKWVAE